MERDRPSGKRGESMFKPNFHYTDLLVRKLTYIAEAQAIIQNAPLVPKWEVNLRRDAILKSAHASTAIEGNPLTLEEVSALAEGREIMARRKDRQEVLNYLEALTTISEYSKRMPFTAKDLLEIHRTITKGTMEEPKDEGRYRERQVVVMNRATGEIVFNPPPTKEVSRLVDELLGWFNSKDVLAIDAVIEAGIVHYEMARIHPFIDGNGRTARVMASLTLYIRGFDVKRFFALDDYYDQDRRGYYEVLERVNPSTLDLTDWLEYFSDGVAASVKAVKEKIVGLSKDIQFLKDKGQIALTERQMKIVETIVEKGKITNREARKILNISNRAALDEIKTLLELKIIARKGSGRSTHYVMR